MITLIRPPNKTPIRPPIRQIRPNIRPIRLLIRPIRSPI